MLVLRLRERPENAPRRIQVQSGMHAETAAVPTVSGESQEQTGTQSPSADAPAGS